METNFFRRAFARFALSLTVAALSGCAQPSNPSGSQPYDPRLGLSVSGGQVASGSTAGLPTNLVTQIPGNYVGSLIRTYVDPDTLLKTDVAQDFRLTIDSSLRATFYSPGDSGQVVFGSLSFQAPMSVSGGGYASGNAVAYQFSSPTLALSKTGATTPSYVAVQLDLRFANGTSLDMSQSRIYLIDCGYSGGFTCSNQLYSELRFGPALGKR